MEMGRYGEHTVTQSCSPNINAGALEKQYNRLCCDLMNLLCVGEQYRFIEKKKNSSHLVEA